MENILYPLQCIIVESDNEKKVLGILFLQLLEDLMLNNNIPVKKLFIVDVRQVYKKPLEQYFNVKMLTRYTSSNNSKIYLGLIQN